ncbi:MAG TPA: VOC family protein [Ignavibacteria bacterium]|jgi:hypothetical protein
MDNTITHIEIPANNMKGITNFYSKVFGWQIIFDERYSLFRIGKSNTGGGFDAALKPAAEKTGPGLVINVEDIPAKLEDIKAAGGKVVQEKTEIGGGHGFYARFTDCCGNPMQVWAKE